jgi:hypothetical protein
MPPVQHATFLSPFGARAPACFEQRRVFLAPGVARAYDSDEWAGALVVVEYGRVELEWVHGGRFGFGPGDLLWLSQLALQALRNPGPLPLLMVAIRRRDTHRGRCE